MKGMSSPGKSYSESSSRTSTSTSSSSSSSATMSALLRNTTMYGPPTRRGRRRRSRGVGHVGLVGGPDDVRHADLTGEQDVLARLGHRAVSGGDHEDRAVHLRGAG